VIRDDSIERVCCRSHALTLKFGTQVVSGVTHSMTDEYIAGSLNVKTHLNTASTTRRLRFTSHEASRHRRRLAHSSKIPCALDPVTTTPRSRLCRSIRARQTVPTQKAGLPGPSATQLPTLARKFRLLSESVPDRNPCQSISYQLGEEIAG
jgi:hypothetical protein